MSQDPDKPLDDGRIRLPKTDSAMNKIAPTSLLDKEQQKGDITMRPGDEDDETDEEIIRLALKRFTYTAEKEDDNRKASLNDLKFADGEGQWSSDVAAQRRADNRPLMTVNKLPTFINQIVNPWRENRPSINISPVGDRSDVEVAKFYKGLIRHIDRASHADIAYDTAFQHEVEAGWGDVRIITEFEDEKSFDQVVRIERIRNMFSVYRDPGHQDPFGRDARFLFITEMMPREEFKSQYPNADQVPWTATAAGDTYLKNWMNQEEIRVGEYYTLKLKKKTLVKLNNGFVGLKEEIDPKAIKRFGIAAERDTEIGEIMWYTLTCKQILKRTKWPGKIIPVVKFIGNERDIEGKVKYSGVVRNAKDSQRMYNYMRTLGVELTALQPKAPWIMEEGQIAGHEQQWQNANTKTIPYLLYKNVSINNTVAPPPQRQAFAGAPQAVMAEIQAAAQDMMATTGVRFDATLQERVYDESGRALRELRERGDVGTFHYTDNAAQSMQVVGEILVDVIPKIYDTKRVVTILRDDDREESVTIDPNQPQPMARQTQNNNIMKIYNPTIGKYGVTVTIGPSYATKRVEASESMMDFVRALAPANPQMVAGIADLIAKNQDWPGAEEFTARLTKMVPPNLLTADVKDIPPQMQAMLQNMQQQMQRLVQENGQLMKVLMDQQADRAQRQDKIDKDFEAKIIGVVQKEQSSYNQHVGSQLKDLAEGVRMLRDTLSTQQETKNA